MSVTWADSTPGGRATVALHDHTGLTPLSLPAPAGVTAETIRARLLGD
jgi:hypothetical protein